MTKLFVAWFLGLHPERDVLLASYADSLAEDFGRETRQILESDEFKRVFPKTLLRDDIRSSVRWVTKAGGRYFATGVGGGLTGRGGHLLVMDDVVKSRVEADSEAIRKSTWDWFSSVFFTRAEPNASIVFCCTRWHESDLAGMLLAHDDGKDWELVSLPALDDDDNALWPERFPTSELKKIQRQIGERDWSCLYQQNPTPDTGTFFQRAWFDNRYEVAPSQSTVYITFDLAVSTQKSADFSEIAVWGADPFNTIHALDWWYGKETLDKTIDKLLDLVAAHHPRSGFSEAGVIRRAAEPFLQRRMNERGIYCHIEWLNRSADKSAMAQAFAGRAAQGKILFPKNAPWVGRVIEQLVSFPAGKHDDAVDCCSTLGMALNQIHAPPINRNRSSWRPTSWMTR